MRADREQRLYDQLGRSKKAFIKIACASHYIQWETASRWAGAHKILQDSTGDWMIFEKYRGRDGGVFTVASNGLITDPD